MKYYSTNNKDHKVDLKEAVFKSLAPDGGLYMPESIPGISSLQMKDLLKSSFSEIAFQLSRQLFSDDIPEKDLEELVYDAINFETPLVKLNDRLSSLELFHGPTLAFKDVGARFMARMLAWLSRDYDKEIHILVATSGDTGSAVANGFFNVEGIKVHILYPSGLVSPLQEKQFTGLGGNITALEILGSFDDCQRLVKNAFSDNQICDIITLSSANSINLARLLPQSFYYFNAFRQLENHDNVVFCVPSGNFGNLTAGLIAKRMGLDIKHFIAATNVNDIVPQYLNIGKYIPRPSVSTIANAMDVGDPSNFARILDLYNNSHEAISRDITGYSYSDEQIKLSISDVYNKYSYLLDPHGATGFMASENYLKSDPSANLVFLETAHPAKFRETVEEVIGEKLQLPERLKEFEVKEKKSILLSKDYEEFKEYLGRINN